MKTTLQIFTEARALIADPKRWIKGAFETEHGYCLIGAICKATTGDPRKCYAPEIAAPRAILAKCVQAQAQIEVEDDEGFSHVITEPMEYNDHPHVTHADVLRVLDCAIEEAGK